MLIMIKSFRDKETAKIFNREFSKKFQLDMQHQARKKLVMLDASTELTALRIPPVTGLSLSRVIGKDNQHSHKRSMADLL